MQYSDIHKEIKLLLKTHNQGATIPSYKKKFDPRKSNIRIYNLIVTSLHSNLWKNGIII